MSRRAKIAVGVLVALNLYQAWLVHWWSKWALEQATASVGKIFDIPKEQTYEYWLAQQEKT